MGEEENEVLFKACSNNPIIRRLFLGEGAIGGKAQLA